MKLKEIKKAAATLKGVAVVTPLVQNLNASKEHKATILLKREDLQIVRSYKIGGA